MRSSNLVMTLCAIAFVALIVVVTAFVVSLSVPDTVETSPHGFDEIRDQCITACGGPVLSFGAPIYGGQLYHYSTDATWFCTCANPVQ